MGIVLHRGPSPDHLRDRRPIGPRADKAHGHNRQGGVPIPIRRFRRRLNGAWSTGRGFHSLLAGTTLEVNLRHGPRLTWSVVTWSLASLEGRRGMQRPRQRTGLRVFWTGEFRKPFPVANVGRTALFQCRGDLHQVALQSELIRDLPDRSHAACGPQLAPFSLVHKAKHMPRVQRNVRSCLATAVLQASRQQR